MPPAIVIVVAAVLGTEILPAASFAHAYQLFVPILPAAVVGADPLHEQPEELLTLVIQNPVTPTASVAVKLDTETVVLVAVDGMVNAVMTGARAKPWMIAPCSMAVLRNTLIS